jgi:hypothetical protein
MCLDSPRDAPAAGPCVATLARGRRSVPPASRSPRRRPRPLPWLAVRGSTASSIPLTEPRRHGQPLERIDERIGERQNSLMADNPGLQRLALSYDLVDDGRLVARDPPARLVSATGEGALYRRIAALANATDAAIAAAAARYGPLGPVRPLAIPDRALFVWAMGEQVRKYMQGIGRLRLWIASGGQTPIPGRLAPSAHLLAALAETDQVLSQRLLDLFTENGPPLASDEERERLTRAFDEQEQLMLAAIGRRERLLSEQVKKGDAHVRVSPRPGTGRYLGLAARYLRVLVAKAEEVGTTATLIPPDSIGRFATSLQPYIEENIVPTETVTAWRQAATELQTWSAILRATRMAKPAEISQPKALLTLRLQQIDAWPYPTGEQLGTFGRALWTVWPRLVQQSPQRRCTWPDCATMLPVGAHGNRDYCDLHRRETARLRSARRRQRPRSAISPSPAKERFPWP